MAAGDQLRVYRGGYWHHGIDMGDGTVVHFKAKAYGPRAGMARTNLDAFRLGSDKIERLPARHAPIPVEQILQRAQSLLGPMPYNLVLNNCEAVSGYCQGLKPLSPQVEAFLRRSGKDLGERGPVKGALTIAWRVVGRVASLGIALAGRHEGAHWVERATDRHADREWVTDPHDLRWEAYTIISP